MSRVTTHKKVSFKPLGLLWGRPLHNFSMTLGGQGDNPSDVGYKFLFDLVQKDIKSSF